MPSCAVDDISKERAAVVIYAEVKEQMDYSV